MVRALAWLAVAMIGLALTTMGCFNYSAKEPLVVVDSQGYGEAAPDTTVQSGDSAEIQRLKAYAAHLEHELAEAKEDVAKEKSKRKHAEQERDSWKNQAKNLEKELKR
jgi:hypothetical protein